MDNLSFFKQKKFKIFSIVFIVISIINIVVASLVNRSLFQDGTFNLMRIIGSNTLLLNQNIRMRILSVALIHFPVYIADVVFKIQSKNLLLFIYSFPLYCFPLLFSFLNFLLAKKTKRYDIALLSIVLFIFGTLFFEMYAIVEFYVVIQLYWLLFHYFVYDKDYSNNDIISISLLTLFAFYSHEFIGFFGIVLLLILPLYLNKNLALKTKIVKYGIVTSCFISSIIFWLFYITSIGPNLNSDGGLFDFFEIIVCTRIPTFTICNYYLLLFVSTVLLFISLILKKNINWFSIILVCGTFSYLLFAYFSSIQKNIFYYFSEFTRISVFYRFLGGLIFVLILLIILTKDIFFKDRSKVIDTKIQNSFIVAVIIGIFISCIQIFWSLYFYKETQNLQNFAKSQNKVAVDINKYKDASIFNAFLDPKYAPYFGVLISKNSVNKFYFRPYSFEKSKIKYIDLYFDKNSNFIYSKINDKYFYEVPIKNSYWNLTNLKKHFKHKTQ